MNIDTVIATMLNGEPLHDGIVVGIIFTCFYTFYNVFFSAVFTMFKNN